MNEYADAAEAVWQAAAAGTASAILRELTVAPESLSARLADLLDALLRPQGR